ncbi:MAG: LacI family DNA-binding transcriptional regulator [Capsulimonadaceae bacterium]
MGTTMKQIPAGTQHIGLGQTVDRRTEPHAAHVPTLQDVAALAGVSRSAVSAVLHDTRSHTRCSVATKERVRQAAAELAYRPNYLAQSLRRCTVQVQTIGFYCGFGHPNASDPLMGSLLSGMYQECDQQGCDLLIHRSGMLDSPEARLRELVKGKVDGILLYTVQGDPLVDMLAARRFPTVALVDSHPGLSCVTADDAEGSRLLARRTAEGGHKRVLYRLPAVERTSGTRRCRAFVEEAARLDVVTTICRSDNGAGMPGPAELAELSRIDGQRPTAIVCWSDASAAEAYQFLQRMGLADQFDLIGFDGFASRMLPVKIMTVHVPWDSVAAAGVQALRKIISGASVELETHVPVRLVDAEPC